MFVNVFVKKEKSDGTTDVEMQGPLTSHESPMEHRPYNTVDQRLSLNVFARLQQPFFKSPAENFMIV
jgi:hypothetical protein